MTDADADIDVEEDVEEDKVEDEVLEGVGELEVDEEVVAVLEDVGLKEVVEEVMYEILVVLNERKGEIGPKHQFGDSLARSTALAQSSRSSRGAQS